MKKSMLVSAVAGLAIAALASAENIQTSTQSDTFSDIPNFSTAFTFDLFNAANFGGPGEVSLISAEIFLSVNIEGGLLELDNDGVDPATVDAEVGALALASSSLSPFINLSASPVTAAMFNLAANNGDGGTFDPQDPNTEGDFAQLFGSNVSDSDNLLFAGFFAGLFAGNGTFNLDIDATAIFDFGGQGGVSFAGVPVTATITATVVYTYKVVPAPAGAAVLGLGGLMAARRRR